MKFTFKTGALSLVMMAALSSCLKDRGYNDLINAEGAEPIVSIFGGEGGSQVLGVDFTTTAKDVTLFNVNLGSVNLLSQDVTATLDVNPDLLKGTGLELLPAASYTIPNKTLTIKAGQRDVPFVIALNSSKIDLSKSYAIPVSILSASGAKVASNLKNAVYSIKVNNIYSGVYKATGVFAHPTAGPRDINKDKTLATIDANTVQLELGDLGGAEQIQLKVDPATNNVTLLGISREVFPTIGAVNKYDPATKTFTLNYFYNTAAPRVITEKIKKK